MPSVTSSKTAENSSKEGPGQLSFYKNPVPTMSSKKSQSSFRTLRKGKTQSKSHICKHRSRLEKKVGKHGGHDKEALGQVPGYKNFQPQANFNDQINSNTLNPKKVSNFRLMHNKGNLKLKTTAQPLETERQIKQNDFNHNKSPANNAMFDNQNNGNNNVNHYRNNKLEETKRTMGDNGINNEPKELFQQEDDDDDEWSSTSDKQPKEST